MNNLELGFRQSFEHALEQDDMAAPNSDFMDQLEAKRIATLARNEVGDATSTIPGIKNYLSSKGIAGQFSEDEIEFLRDIHTNGDPNKSDRIAMASKFLPMNLDDSFQALKKFKQLGGKLEDITPFIQQAREELSEKGELSSPRGNVISDILGGLGGFASDPAQLATIGLGGQSILFGKGLGALASSAAKVFGTEAAIEAALVQPLIQNRLIETGDEEAGIQEGITNSLMAGLGAVGLQAAFKGIGKGSSKVRKLFKDKAIIKKMETEYKLPKGSLSRMGEELHMQAREIRSNPMGRSSSAMSKLEQGKVEYTFQPITKFDPEVDVKIPKFIEDLQVDRYMVPTEQPHIRLDEKVYDTSQQAKQAAQTVVDSLPEEVANELNIGVRQADNGKFEIVHGTEGMIVRDSPSFQSKAEAKAWAKENMETGRGLEVVQTKDGSYVLGRNLTESDKDLIRSQDDLSSITEPAEGYSPSYTTPSRISTEMEYKSAHRSVDIDVEDDFSEAIADSIAWADKLDVIGAEDISIKGFNDADISGGPSKIKEYFQKTRKLIDEFADCVSPKGGVE